MQRKMTVLISVCIALFLVIGCSASRGYVEAPSDNILTGGLVKSGYVIADTLLSQSKLRIGNNDTILVASFANINNLQESSTLGRMLAEHVASRLSQRGYKVIDMRLRMGSVFMEEGRGEFLLSRDLRDVSKNYNAAAVVVGTYGESLNGIYVSARIINPLDSTIISSCDYGLAIGRGASELLTRNR